ncbi:MAG: exodeoxyribonuclease V subunit gamma [Acidimicrobiales bacterium]
MLHRAERADVLADVLAGLLEAPLGDPFRAEVVAVHSRGVERWLAHRLAARLGATPGRADGMCANLAFPFPGRLVGDALARATGVDAATDAWRPERLAWPLLAVVEADLDEAWLSVLAGHLGRGDEAASDRDRRFATVRHLADLFDRYGVHRPAMVRAWAAGADTDGDGAPLPADAAWQAELWRRLRAVMGTDSPAERLAGGCAALEADPDLADLPDRLALFGLTRLPASYLDVLGALAAHREVHILALHPSPAAWGRIAELAPAAPDKVASAAADATHHPLLRSWGRDSREMQLVLGARLASNGASERHHPLPDAAAPTTLLHRLQAAIRADEAPAGDVDRPLLAPTDRSLQVHACHGRARQAEVVRDAITHLLAADPELEPRDVVVLCPDIDEFAPLLHAAFTDRGPALDAAAPGGAPHLPYRLADRSLRQTNPVLGALSELLALVDARLTASQVLRFAALAPVRHRFRLDDDDLERLAGWVAATGTRWGLDAAHRAPFDLHTVEAGTWDAGLVRLLLGVAMAEDDQRLVGGALPLDDVDAGDIELAGRVAELVGRLGEVVRDLTAARPVAGWVEALDRAANLLLATRAADAWQRGQLDRVLADVTTEAGSAPGVGLRLAEVRDLLADRLRGRPTRAAFRTGDLTMCTLVPMRSVPHRVVCLVGLDDGAFPRGGSPDGDDLLVRARHVGDHDRRAEDRQLLLDAVLAAGEALVITYAGRDVRTNEDRPPAVPVHELLDVVDATVQTADGAPARTGVVRHHPLQPSDRRCFERGALGVDGPWGFDPLLLDGARAAARPRSAPAPFLTGLLPSVAEELVALDELVAFVSHPVRAFLRQRLGLSRRTDEDRPIDALRVELDALEQWAVGDRLLEALLRGGDVEAVCAAEVARGTLPPGALGDDALHDARQKAEAIAELAHRAAVGSPGSLEIDVALAGGRRLVGTVPDVIGDLIRPTTFSSIGPKQRLAAWARFLAATASHPDRAVSSALVGWRRGAVIVPLEPFAGSAAERAATAVAHLDVLVDLLDRGRRAPLPLYCRTSHAYAERVNMGRGDADGIAAKQWTSGYDWPKEDRDPEHVYVLGGVVPFVALLDTTPAPDEAGPGWADDEASRFGRLARRLWDPYLDAGARRTS